MGRASGQTQTAAAVGFAALFGERRGTRCDDGLRALHPNAQAQAFAGRLCAQLQRGQYGETVDILAGYRHSQLNKYPLLATLVDELAGALQQEQLQANDQPYHEFVQLVSLRSYWADQLVAVTDTWVSADDGEERVPSTIHVWPDGKSRGERHLDGRWASHAPVAAACGRQLAVAEVSRLVPRGAWRQPTFDNDGSPWNYRRCRDCEAAQLNVPDVDEEPRTHPVLGPTEQTAWEREARARLRASLPRLLGRAARNGDPQLLCRHTKRVICDTLTEVVARRLADDGDVALARIQGYLSEFERQPNYEEWRELLDGFKPTTANITRYAALRGRHVNDKNILSKFDAAVRRLTVSLNLEPVAGASDAHR